MYPDDNGFEDVLEEFGMGLASLDPENPVVLMSSTAAATDGGNELFAAAERSLNDARSSRCVSVIAIDYAGSDPIKMGFPSGNWPSVPFFDIWLIGREERQAMRLCQSEVSSAERTIDYAIAHIIDMSDAVG